MKKNRIAEIKTDKILVPGEVKGEVKDEVKEIITNEELNQIKTLQSKAVYATVLVEKAYAEARVAELEVNNFTLAIFNKYKLVSGKDSITTDGTILRAE